MREDWSRWTLTQYFNISGLVTFLMMLPVILLSILMILLSILNVWSGSLDVTMDGSVLEEKTSFKMLGLTFSFKLDRGSYIISVATTTSKKIGSLIRSMKSLSPEVALYLYKSIIHPYLEYCCQIWACAPSCYLGLLDKLQKWICRTVGPSLAAFLDPLTHHWNVVSLSPFYKY